jgi:hypothetical protein
MPKDDGPDRPRVDPKDGPVARIGTPEWDAWKAYYVAQRRMVSAAEMERYKRKGVDWPVTSTWPPNVQGKTG